MSLTGIPLITLSIVVTAALATASAMLWSRYPRWRVAGRIAGVLLTEILVVFSIGLIVNRVDGFYPSWQALAGKTGTTVITAKQRAGRLDQQLHGLSANSLVWHAADAATWRLAGPPMVVTPSGYRARTTVSYPAVVNLVDRRTDEKAAVKAARSLAAVSVVVNPTAATTASGLATLPGDLAMDVRTTSVGWAIVATAKQAPLAEEMISAAPNRYVSLIVVDGSAGPVMLHEQPGIAMAVVRTAAPAVHRGPTQTRLTGGVTWLTSPASALWRTAADWAAGETSLPLSAPELLPTSIKAGKS